MREIPCEPLDSISGSALHKSLLEASRRLRRSSWISLAIALIFLFPVTIAIIPFLVFWAGWVAYTTLAFISSLSGLLSAEGWAAYDLAGFAMTSLVSFAVDLFGAMIVVVYFVFAVWAWNALKTAVLPGQNIATKAVIAEDAAGVRKATAVGPFGTLYGVFESALGRILSLAGTAPAALYSSIYPQGALVLVTPCSRWPIAPKFWKGRGFSLIAREEGGRLVLALMQKELAIAIGVFKKEHRAAILAKIGRTKTD